MVAAIHDDHEEDVGGLPQIFRALASAERLELLRILNAAPAGMTVTEIVRRTEIDRFRISRHLRALREVGLVIGVWDGRSHVHRVDSHVLELIEDWIYDLLPLGNAA